LKVKGQIVIIDQKKLCLLHYRFPKTSLWPSYGRGMCGLYWVPRRIIHLSFALAESREARLQLSLIPLFLRHPEFAVYVKAVAKKLNPVSQLILKCFYSAAVWLEQKHLSRNKLPDLFSKELGILLHPSPEENLHALAQRQRELSESRINWLGTYQHAADIWLKELELQQA